MEQIPLRGPEDGAISLHPLGASAAISIAPLQHVCLGGAMEIAPSSGPGNGNCSLVELYYKVLIIRNCWVSARGAKKLHPFGTRAELSEARVPKGCNFFAPQALTQQLYY